MPRYWMITNRNVSASGLGRKHSSLSYWVTDSEGVDDFGSWQKSSESSFRNLLKATANEFPAVAEPWRHEEQQHVTLFVHGFNNTWQEAAKRYRGICRSVIAPPAGATLGTCLLFTWPSDGMVTNYLPDRMDAERSAPELAEVLASLFDHLLDRQVAGAADPADACKAKTSMIAHSMGNYVLQKAMQYVWTRKNQPLLVSLLNQLVMVAADVDNDLFKSGESQEKSDGDAIANLCYRISVLYSGMDNTLGVSAGLKHFGKRRLGRAGLDPEAKKPDNVWEQDCSRWFKPGAIDVHSAYFEAQPVVDLMRSILRGTDRNVIGSRLPPV